MAAATMVSLPPTPTMTTAILTLIALALALPWTRIGRRGGGRAVMHLIRRCALEYMEHVVTTYHDISEMIAVE